jgi:Fe-S oxidoreductase
VVYDSRQTCCGQPTFNAGHCDDTIPYARHLLSVFDDNLPVVCPPVRVWLWCVNRMDC